jgi:hypothetical protein
MAGKEALILFLFFPLQILSALDLKVSGRELALAWRPEYHRALGFCQDLAASGALELDNRYALRAGLALGNVDRGAGIKLFTAGEIALPAPLPLYFNLAYIYNGLPGWETHTHGVLPFVSLKGRRAGIALGINFRLSSFFNEAPVFESMLSISGYVNLIVTDVFTLGLRCANFNDFNAGNMGSYSLTLENNVRLSKQFALSCDIELIQSGSVALTANFYGLAFRAGVVYRW